jgi:hypothetical protein
MKIMKSNGMYYDRTISDSFSALIEQGGELRWLFEFVKSHSDLDFLIGKQNSKEWISVYRGLSRMISIKKTQNPSIIKIDGDTKYQSIKPSLYGDKHISENFKPDLDYLLNSVSTDSRFDKHYNNKKEGYYQNELSRKHGIIGNKETDFVIIDKEAVIGYKNQPIKDKLFGTMQNPYKELQTNISKKDSKRYGKDLQKKSIGSELDFLALDKDGNVLLIEYKDASNPSGIYLSPLQIGLYYDIFTKFPRENLETSIFKMFDQKQKIGLINPNWKKPDSIKNIIPVLIISEYKYKSIAKTKYSEILELCRSQFGTDFLSNIVMLNYTNSNLINW